MSAPVLRRCRSSSAVQRPWPTRPRSIACPPTMPATPAASASTLTARRRRSAGGASTSPIPARRRRPPREHAEGLRQQAIAGKNREAVAIDDVSRRTASPQRVVVHRRQVVVHERVRVDHLDRARRRQCQGARRIRRDRDAVRHGVSRGECQTRPQALAGSEERVVDGRGDDRRPAQAGEHPLESDLDLGPQFAEVRSEPERRPIIRHRSESAGSMRCEPSRSSPRSVSCSIRRSAAPSCSWQ